MMICLFEYMIRLLKTIFLTTWIFPENVNVNSWACDRNKKWSLSLDHMRRFLLLIFSGGINRKFFIFLFSPLETTRKFLEKNLFYSEKRKNCVILFVISFSFSRNPLFILFWNNIITIIILKVTPFPFNPFNKKVEKNTSPHFFFIPTSAVCHYFFGEKSKKQEENSFPHKFRNNQKEKNERNKTLINPRGI